MYMVTYGVKYEGCTNSFFDTLEAAEVEAQSIKTMNCNGDYFCLKIYKVELVAELAL